MGKRYRATCNDCGHKFLVDEQGNITGWKILAGSGHRG